MFPKQKSISTYAFIDNLKSLCSPRSFSAGIFTYLQATSSVLHPPIPNSLGHTELKAIWAIPLNTLNPSPSNIINIAFVEPEQFHKYAKNLEISCIWYTTNSELNMHINSLTIGIYDPDSPPPEPPPVTANIINTNQNMKKMVPKKYHNYLDMFSPTEVMQLPDHQPYNINIELEEGKTPPFSPIYSLSQDECKALFDYIKNNLSKEFIHCSTSSATSPILFIKQKTRDLHLCVDYQGLNAITRKNQYPPTTHS